MTSSRAASDAIRVSFRAAAVVLPRLVAVGAAALGASRLLHRVHLHDDRLVRLARAHATPRSDRLVRAVTSLGSGEAVALGTAVSAVTLVARRRPVDAASVVAASLGAGAINVVVGRLVARARPRFHDVVPPRSASFPSGHALASSAFATSLALVGGGAHAGLLAAYALAMGASRVVLGVHWPSDVVAGWTLGTIWAVASRASVVASPA